MNRMQLIIEAIGSLEEALSTAKMAVDQENPGLAMAAGHFAAIAKSLLYYAAEAAEEEE